MSRNVSVSEIQKALGVLWAWSEDESVGPDWGRC